MMFGKNIRELRYCESCKREIPFKKEKGMREYLKRRFCSNSCHGKYYKDNLIPQQKGHIPWNKGKKMSKEYCEQISNTMKGKCPKNIKQIAGWNRGIGGEQKYPLEFNESLRELVRQRDNYKCQLCGVPQIECETKLSIHHVNHIRKDNRLVNLISLCNKCHSQFVVYKTKSAPNRYITEQAGINTYSFKGGKYVQ